MAASSTARQNTVLRIIATFKVLKGALLFGLGIGFFRLINRDLGELVRGLTFRLRIDPENTEVRHIIEKIAKIEPRTLRQYGWLSLFFAVDLIVEGVGLWLNQTWAKYLVLVAYSAFVPYEVYIIFAGFTWERLMFLSVNVAVVAYVARLLWRERKDRLPGAAQG